MCAGRRGRTSSSDSSSESPGFATYAAGVGVDWSVLAVGLAGAIPGGWLGARATGKLPENVLRLALGVVLVLVGVAFAVQAIL